MHFVGRAMSYAPAGIFAIALVFLLQEAQTVFAPVILAIVVGIVMSPLADYGRRKGLSNVSVALGLMLTGGSLVALIVWGLSRPVTELVDQWPSIWSRVQLLLIDVRSALSSLQTVQEKLSQAMSGDEGLAVTVQQGSNLGAALSYAPSMLAQTLVFIGALFFFILSRKPIYNAIAQTGRTRDERVQMAEILDDAESRVARYFLSISLINTGLGIATGIVLAVLGMPFAAVWGLVAAVLNFVPYLGPALFTGMLTIGGIIHFPGLYALLPALCFVGLNLLEGQFITPGAIGRIMTVNPLLVFVSLVFWIWLWGAIGGIVAIPLLLIGTALVSAGERTRLPPEPLIEEA